MMVTRRSLLATAGLALPLVSACQPHNAGGVLTACDVHRDGYPTVTAVKWLGEALSKETGGRLSIRSYPSGQLGGEDDTISLAQSGVIDICRANAAALNNAFPLTQVVSMPFVIQNDDHLHRVLDGPIGQEILDGFAARGLIGLASYDAGGRCFYNTQRPIETPKDLHGLKIRVPQSDVFIEAVGAMGANPTPLGFSAVYSSLQSRLIDGAENNWPTFETARHLEVAHYWSQTQHSYSPEFLMMSAKSFGQLSKKDQDLVRELAKASVPIMREAWVKTESESRTKALAAGTKVVEVNKAAFKAVCDPVNAQRLKNPDVARLYAAIKAMV
jgi:tripartite ATP-independent transporter DctP family solute receptor